MSSYLWSHYGDLLGEEESSDAYAVWARQIESSPGLTLDLGGAVGRFTFELGGKSDLAVGIDRSRSFIRAARTLLREGRMSIRLKEEGRLTREVTVQLPEAWTRLPLDFIVADVLRLPFRARAAATVTSLNLLDKVPSPMAHLREMDRVAALHSAQLLISDPFSWSADVAEENEWLGGQAEGPYQGHGLDTLKKLFRDGKTFTPSWRERDAGHIWWRIRTHRNHYELIRSCYLKVTRSNTIPSAASARPAVP